MGEPTHQTIKLVSGKHTSPTHGACVMELASMLAGEPFTDHPQCVCPVVGAVLRQYNDWIDDRRRQDLYEYAARVVGSYDEALVEPRIDLVLEWTQETRQRRWLHRLLPIPVGSPSQLRQPEVVARGAVHALARRNDRTHAEVLGLIDVLLALGARPRGIASESYEPRERPRLATTTETTVTR
jgi:hypothetical protein